MRPTARLMMSHPAHFISLGFGSGLSPKAPGTVGSLAAVLLWWLFGRAKPEEIAPQSIEPAKPAKKKCKGLKGIAERAAGLCE